MTVQDHPLFREEALQHRADRLQGNVNIATPLSWQVIGYLLLVVLIIVAIFLFEGSYSRVETVSGSIALDTGVATIVPSRPGVVADVEVVEGQAVSSGQRLVLIRAEERMMGGGTEPDRISASLERQDVQLAAQGRLLMEAADADRDRLDAQIAGDRTEISELNGQIADQQLLIASATADYDNAVKVAEGGFVSRRDIEQRKAAILSRRQELARLQQALVAKRTDIAQASSAITQSAMTARAQVATAQSDRAALSRQMAEAELARGYAVTSPVAGTVTALTARLGQPVTPSKQLMLVVPMGAKPRAELLVPTAASGFLAPGQEVRLSIDAFPYQTFGTVPGLVTAVSRATVNREEPNEPDKGYLVTVSVPRPWVEAFGRKRPLLPGMTLSARIVTERRSLVAWLFEPLLAVGKR